MTTTTKRRPWCPVRGTMWMPDIDLNDIEWHREPRNPAEVEPFRGAPHPRPHHGHDSGREAQQ